MTPSGEGVSLLQSALRGRCPACGVGPLFTGILKVRDKCATCGLDFRSHDSGDGPAVAGVFIVGAAAVIAAVVTDIKYQPPFWVHAVLWPVPVVLLTVGVMRLAKAGLIVLQYRHRSGEAGS